MLRQSMSFIVSIDINRVVGTTKKNHEKNETVGDVFNGPTLGALSQALSS